MSLKKQIYYIERNENVIVISCAMYRRRQIFYADDDNVYIKSVTGSYQYPSLDAVTKAIDIEPDKFPVLL